MKVAAFTIPAHGFYFVGYELSKKLILPSKSSDEKGVFVYFISGFIADITGSFVWTPQDVIKQRIQVQKKIDGKYQYNSYTAFRSILRESGVRGLFKGYWAGIATYGILD